METPSNKDREIENLKRQLEELSRQAKIDNDGNQEWINSLCHELCKIEDALGFRQDQHDKDGTWKPTIECCLEKIRDYVAMQANYEELQSSLKPIEDGFEDIRETAESLLEGIDSPRLMKIINKAQQALNNIREGRK